MKSLAAAARILLGVVAVAPPTFAQSDVLTSGRLLCTVESTAQCKSGVVTECESRELTEDERNVRLLLDWKRGLVLLVSDQEEKPLAFILHDRLEQRQRIVAFADRTGPVTFLRLSADGRMTGERKDDRVTFAGECSPGE